MSYNTWHTYGYGIRTDDIEVKSVKALEKLLKKAPEFYKDVREHFAECEIEHPTVQDYLNCSALSLFPISGLLEDPHSCHRGLAYLLREVIAESAGIELCDCDDVDGREFLLFTPEYPWYFKKRQKAYRMTEDKLDALFVRYLKIITDVPPKPGYEEVENGG